MYTTVTSKGTTTIPSELRKIFGIREGSRLAFSSNQATGEITIKPVPSIETIRAMNRKILKRNGNWPPKPYISGDGFRQHVAENMKYYEPK